MEIHLTTGLGTGPTPLAAFDAALLASGVHNYNLIQLSSVIPEKSKIIEHTGKIPLRPGSWGDRLYVVMAQHRVDRPNEEAWAGIGWMQAKDGRGVFVEHHGSSETTVKQDITDSLEALRRHRKSTEFGKIHMKLQGGVCHGTPLCVLSVAAYQASDWENVPDLYKTPRKKK